MSKYVPLYVDLTEHPKFKKLRRRLPASIPAAQGHLAGLWRFGWKYALDDGDLSSFENADIAEAGWWEDDPDHFVNALAEAGFLDLKPGGGYTIHNWDSYTGEYRAHRENGDKGRHTRFHVNKGIKSPGCKWCGSGVASGVASGNRTELNGTESKEPKSPAPQTDEPREDVESLCSLLQELVVKNGTPASRVTISKTWRKSARLLLDKDERPLEQAIALVRWSQGDEFWRGHILSMPKFREKYDTLRLQRDQEGSRRKGSNSGSRAQLENRTAQDYEAGWAR